MKNKGRYGVKVKKVSEKGGNLMDFGEKLKVLSKVVMEVFERQGSVRERERESNLRKKMKTWGSKGHCKPLTMDARLTTNCGFGHGPSLVGSGLSFGHRPFFYYGSGSMRGWASDFPTTYALLSSRTTKLKSFN